VTVLIALIRTVVVAVAIWVGQSLLGPSHKTGIWAMVSLGIASAIAGVLLTRVVARSHRRVQEAALQSVATAVILAVYYLLLPISHIITAGYDLMLVIGVAVLSGLSEWMAPDIAPITKPRT